MQRVKGAYCLRRQKDADDAARHAARNRCTALSIVPEDENRPPTHLRPRTRDNPKAHKAIAEAVQLEDTMYENGQRFSCFNDEPASSGLKDDQFADEEDENALLAYQDVHDAALAAADPDYATNNSRSNSRSEDRSNSRSNSRSEDREDHDDRAQRVQRMQRMRNLAAKACSDSDSE